MIKLLLLGAAIYIAWRLFANDIKKKLARREEEEKREQEERAACGEMAQDPECGAYVSVEDSISVRDGAKTYYFCGYDCREKFLKKLAAGGHTLENGKNRNV